MRNLFLFALLVIFLIMVQFASAKTVDEIIERYIAALGGKVNLDEIKTIYMEGTRSRMNDEVAVKIVREKSKLSRTEFKTSTGNGFTLVTDKEAWNYFSSVMTEPEKVTLTIADLDIINPLSDYHAKGYRAELAAKEMVDDHSCYKIKLTAASGTVVNYWIDTSSYLLLQSSVPGMGAEPGALRSEILTFYKDYKPVDGILFPHTIEVINPNGEIINSGVTVFDKIEINKQVEEKYYRPFDSSS